MRNPDLVIRAARRLYPREACGITVDGLAVVLTNVSPNPTKTFRVEPEELSAAIELNDGVWDGVWHSHPDGQELPSDDDVSWHPPNKALYIVTLEAVYEYDSSGAFVAVHRGG